MHKLPQPYTLHEQLVQDELFTDWYKQHGHAFLTHFFCQVNNAYKAKTNWEIGYFDHEKITVFTATENGFAIKPADDVFKKPAEKIEALEMKKIKVSLDKAVGIFKDKLKEYFPQELLGDGFLILQTYQGKTVWNFSFITKAVRFVNIKVTTDSGEVTDHQLIELLQK
jgi:hypothetical protein